MEKEGSQSHTDAYIALRRLLERLKKNEANVSRADLEGRYRKSYQKLKGDIKAEAEKILEDWLIDGLLISDDEAGRAALSRIQGFLAEEDAGRELGRILFSEYSVDKFYQAVSELRREVQGLVRGTNGGKQ